MYFTEEEINDMEQGVRESVEPNYNYSPEQKINSIINYYYIVRNHTRLVSYNNII